MATTVPVDVERYRTGPTRRRRPPEPLIVHVQPVIDDLVVALRDQRGLASDDPSLDAAVSALVETLGPALRLAPMEFAQHAAVEVDAQRPWRVGSRFRTCTGIQVHPPPHRRDAGAMSWVGIFRSLGEALGVVPERASSVGCHLGRVAYRETRRAAQIANITRPRRTLAPETQAMLGTIFPDLDVGAIRVRTRCRLPANRFEPSGSIYAMTFGNTIYWRDDLDESDPVELVHLIHETTHIDQVRRLGGEDEFACEYGVGYLQGGGELPAHIAEPSDYHRNPLEAEAYRKESEYRDDHGRVVPSRLPR